jgi:hypothetical protein
MQMPMPFTLSSGKNTNNPIKEEAMNYMSVTTSRTFPNINLAYNSK